MTQVDFETVFMDIIEEVLDFTPSADHQALLEQITQKLADDGHYDLKILYDHNEELNEALNHIFEEEVFD